MDLASLDGKAVLHIVDSDRQFQNAAFTRDKTAEGLWAPSIEVWPSVYTGYPDILSVDRESSIIAKGFIAAADRCGVVVQTSCIETRNALDVGERYQHPLRRVYAAVQKSDEILRDPLALRLTIKALNDTMGPRALVPSFLVLRKLPRFVSARDPATHKRRLAALSAAKEEADRIA